MTHQTHGSGSLYRNCERTGFSANRGLPELHELCTEAAATLDHAPMPILSRPDVSVTAIRGRQVSLCHHLKAKQAQVLISIPSWRSK